MVYTVKQLAEISKVSVRTLRWYDEIDLLKPAYYGDNNYRYYKEVEVLKLQQILFFRELGFSLDNIKSLLMQADFDKVKVLKAHRQKIINDIDQKHRLIATIDKTINYLEKEGTMKIEEIFDGFTAEKQKFYENYLVDKGVDKKIIQDSKEKMQSWSKERLLEHKQAGDKIHDDLIECINQGLSPESDTVQNIVHQHYSLTCKIWIPDCKSYIDLGQLYGSNPEFVEFYANLHPKLLQYLQTAIEVYAKNSLN